MTKTAPNANIGAEKLGDDFAFGKVGLPQTRKDENFGRVHRANFIESQDQSHNQSDRYFEEFDDYAESAETEYEIPEEVKNRIANRPQSGHYSSKNKTVETTAKPSQTKQEAREKIYG